MGKLELCDCMEYEELCHEIIQLSYSFSVVSDASVTVELCPSSTLYV